MLRNRVFLCKIPKIHGTHGHILDLFLMFRHYPCNHFLSISKLLVLS